MCEHTPGHGTHQIMQIHPQSYNQLKGVFFISTYLIMLPLKATFRIINAKTYGNYWTWP